MRNSFTLLAAVSAIGLVAAGPMQRRYEPCTAPQQFYTCGENGADFQGCCSKDPCRGSAEGVSFCLDNGNPPTGPDHPQPEQPAPDQPQPEQPQPEQPGPDQPIPCDEPETPEPGPGEPGPGEPQPQQPGPDQPQPEQPQPEQPQPEPPVACNPGSTPAPAPAPAPAPQPGPDSEWLESGCKADDSDCNWSPTYYIIKSNSESYTTFNSTIQFHVQKDDGADGARRDSIALFTGIPESVNKCRIMWYKPEKGIFYGTYGDGSIDMSTLDLGGKEFGEVVGKDVNYGKVKDLIAKQSSHGILDLGNWGRSIGGQKLDNGHDAFDCSGSEVVVHFSLTASVEGSVIVDQGSKFGQFNGFVERAGWFLQYV